MDIARIRQLIIDAGQLELLPRFNKISFKYKQDGSLLTEADLAVQQRLQLELHQLWPEIPLLGEEMSESEQAAILQKGEAAFWCLDPLDGTSNFAAGIPLYSISLALIRHGQPELAVVYDPERDECFSAVAGHGAWLNDHRLDVADLPHRPLSRCSAIIDFKRLPEDLATRIAAQPPYASQRSFGSVALDWAWLACGRGHVYLHGKQKLWDYAAGWLVHHEAGGRGATLAGERGFVASLTPRSSVAATTPSLFNEWAQWLGLPEHGKQDTD